MATLTIGASQGILTLASQGILTLASQWRIDTSGPKITWSQPTRGSGSFAFPLSTLPGGAKISAAYVRCDFNAQSNGTVTVAGKQAARPLVSMSAQISIPVSAYAAKLLSVPVTWQALPDGTETPYYRDQCMSLLKCSGASITIHYTLEGGGGGSGGGDVSQSGGLLHVVSPGRQGRSPLYYGEQYRDYSKNGSPLRPVEALIEEEENGSFTASLELPMDEAGSWRQVAMRGVIKLPAPARRTLALSPGISGQEEYEAYTPSNSRGYIYLYSAPSSLDGESVNLKRVKNGEKLLKAGEAQGVGGLWLRVTDQMSGITGYALAADLTKTGSGESQALIPALQTRDQLFRVYKVEPDIAKTSVRVEARHVFYDLGKAVLVGSGANLGDGAPLAQALDALRENADHPIPFAFYTDCAGTIKGDFRGKNLVEALLDPEEGIAAQAGGVIVRDNFDVYLIKHPGEDRGVRIQHGRNCLGAKCSYDADAMANRIVAKLGDSYSIHDDPARPADAEILTVYRSYNAKDGTAAEQAAKEFEKGIGGGDLTLDVDFVLLSDTADYARYAGLQVMYLGDTVHMSLPQGRFDAKITGYAYNAITRQYDEIHAGPTSSQRAKGSLPSYQIGGVGSVKILGQMAGYQIQDGAIDRLKIAEALVKDLQAESIEAVEANIQSITAGKIGAEQLTAGAITADKIDAGAVTAEKIAAGAITAAKIGAGEITAEKIEAGAVTANAIQSKAITTEKIAAGAITAGSGIIADGAVGTAQIADASITDAKIVGLTANKITAGTINAKEVNINDLNADNITTGTINGQRIPVLGTEKIADGAIIGDKIASDAVTADKIVAAAVTADKLAANSVTANKILAGAITTDKLLASSVTTEKIAAGAITANKISAEVGSSLDLSSNTSLNSTVTKALDGLEIGGRNLVPDSEGPLDLVADPMGRIILQGDYRGTFTFAADVTKGPNDTATNTRIQCMIDYADGTRDDLRAGNDYNNAERDGITRRKTLTFTTREGAEVQRLVLVPMGFSAQGENPRDASAERIKLERGTKATDWTPNPDDTKNAISQIRQEADSISIRVGLVEDNMQIPPEELENSSVTINTEGIEMATTGHFRLYANDGSGSQIKLGGDDTGANFSVDERGAVSAKAGDFAEGLTVANSPVWTKKGIIVSATQPQNVSDVVWIQPQAGVQQVNHSLQNTSQAYFVHGVAKSYTLLPESGDTLSSGGSYEYTLSLRLMLGVNTNYTPVRFTAKAVLNATAGTVTLGSKSFSLQGWSSVNLTITGTSGMNLFSASEGVTVSITITADEVGNTYLYIPNGDEMRLISRNTAAAGSGAQPCAVFYIPYEPTETIAFSVMSDGAVGISGTEFIEQVDGSILLDGASFVQQADGSVQIE